jgi:hypothetical protein
MTTDEIVRWFALERTPALDRGDAVALLASSQPRTLFIKSLPLNCEILQIGAEFGSIDVYLQWPPPVRKDLRLFALVGSSTPNLGGYEQVEIGDFSRPEESYRDKKFDAVICSMVLQRLADPTEMLDWMAKHTVANARIFLEWASPFAALLPSRVDLNAERVELSISNFTDDLSNSRIHERSRVVSLLSKSGFFIESQGYLSLPFVEEEILAHRSQGLKDSYAIQVAFWSKTRWVQYVVGVRL